MQLALLGGTGDLGRGLTLRWAFHTDHAILVGSRDPERAKATALEYERQLEAVGADARLDGVGNETAARRADVVVLAVPPHTIEASVDAIAEALDDETILVSPAVGIGRDDDGVHYHPPPNDDSVTELVDRVAPEDVPVVGAYHTLPASPLAELEADLDVDTLLVGDDAASKATIRRLTEEIEGLQAFDAGPVANAAAVERLTPLLITLARHNAELHDVGVRFR